VFEYYRNLIALRKAHPAFRMTTTQTVATNLKFLDTASTLQIAFTLDGAAVYDSWKSIVVAFNGSRNNAAITIPAGNWTVVCDDAVIDLNGLGQVTGGSITLKPSSAFIAYKNN
jgi:pullulanase